MLGSGNCANDRGYGLCHSVKHPLMMSPLLSVYLTQQLVFLGAVDCSREGLQSGVKPSILPPSLTAFSGLDVDEDEEAKDTASGALVATNEKKSV